MKSLVLGLLPVAIQAAGGTGRASFLPAIKKEEFHKIPLVARALQDLGLAYSHLDGPGSNVAGKKPSPFSQLPGQIGAIIAGMTAPALEPVRREALTPRFVKTASRNKVRYGPFDVKANSVSRLNFPCIHPLERY
jgi:hypothetical protein